MLTTSGNSQYSSLHTPAKLHRRGQWRTTTSLPPLDSWLRSRIQESHARTMRMIRFFILRPRVHGGRAGKSGSRGARYFSLFVSCVEAIYDGHCLDHNFHRRMRQSRRKRTNVEGSEGNQWRSMHLFVRCPRAVSHAARWSLDTIRCSFDLTRTGSPQRVC